MNTHIFIKNSKKIIIKELLTMNNNQLWRKYRLYCYKNGLADGNYKNFREFMIKYCVSNN